MFFEVINIEIQFVINTTHIIFVMTGTTIFTEMSSSFSQTISFN